MAAQTERNEHIPAEVSFVTVFLCLARLLYDLASCMSKRSLLHATFYYCHDYVQCSLIELKCVSTDILLAARSQEMTATEKPGFFDIVYSGKRQARLRSKGLSMCDLSG